MNGLCGGCLPLPAFARRALLASLGLLTLALPGAAQTPPSDAMQKGVREYLDSIPGIIEQTKKITAERMKELNKGAPQRKAQAQKEAAAEREANTSAGQELWDACLLKGAVQTASVTPEVLGIRLGMTDDEARVALLTDERLKEGREDFLRERTIKGPDKLKLKSRAGAFPDSSFNWERTGSGRVPPGERLEYIVAGPREEVAVVERFQSLSSGNAVTEGNLRLALLEKYGEPSFEDTRWDDSMSWVLKGGRECVPFSGHPLSLRGLESQVPCWEEREAGAPRRFYIPWNWEMATLEPGAFTPAPSRWRYGSITKMEGCSYLRVLWGSDANREDGKTIDVPTDDDSLVKYIHTELVDYDRLVEVVVAQKSAKESAKEEVRSGAGTRKPRL